MSSKLIERMNFHGYVVENGVFYEVMGTRIMTIEQALAWVKKHK